MSDSKPAEGEPADGITDQTGEYGAGVDQDTGANVGDTGKPRLKDASEQDSQAG